MAKRNGSRTAARRQLTGRAGITAAVPGAEKTDFISFRPREQEGREELEEGEEREEPEGQMRRICFEDHQTGRQ
jgi:hypothetical protein